MEPRSRAMQSDQSPLQQSDLDQRQLVLPPEYCPSQGSLAWQTHRVVPPQRAFLPPRLGPSLRQSLPLVVVGPCPGVHVQPKRESRSFRYGGHSLRGRSGTDVVSEVNNKHYHETSRKEISSPACRVRVGYPRSALQAPKMRMADGGCQA